MARLLIGIIHMYRWLISPLFPPRCRFEPTCSHYAIHALATYGIARGLWLVCKRLVRCHPYEKLVKQLGPTFGYDPVPVRPANAANESPAKSSVTTS